VDRRILISWGIVAMLTGFVHTVHQMYIVRFLLGLAEAGYFPGIALYLTYWFPQRETGAGACAFDSGHTGYHHPGSSAFGSDPGSRALARSQQLAVAPILEGMPALAGGVLTYILLPGRPQEASSCPRKRGSGFERNWT